MKNNNSANENDCPKIIECTNGRIIILDSKNPEDIAFIREAYGFEAETRGYFREDNRLFMFNNALTEKEANQELAGPPPASILEVPEPSLPDGPLEQSMFTLDDGTELRWIKHPRALPAKCRPFWRKHTSMFVIEGKELDFTAYTSIHAFAALDGGDGKHRMFGPGGIRWIDYPDRESAIIDAMDMSLAVGMKIQVVRTPNAGNKVAVYGQLNHKDKLKALRSIYKAYERLGLIITSADLGLSLADLEEAALPVAPTSIVPMGVYRDGIPSALVTADASIAGMEAMAESLDGCPSLSDLTISIQGLGEVGYRMVEHLVESGCKVVVAENNPETKEKFTSQYSKAVETGQVYFLEKFDDIYDAKVDMFVPCALRDILTDKTLARLKKAGVKIIGGPANNLFPDQIKGPWAYHQADMPVVPYEGIGAGGVTGVAFSVMSGVYGKCPFTISEKTDRIRNYVAKNLLWAKRYDLPPQVISDRVLFNSTQRRRLLDQERADRTLEIMRKAFQQNDPQYEHDVVCEFGKKGFFYGAGRHPKGGWKYY